MHGVVPISQRGRQERGQGHVRERDGDGDGDGHSERESCAYAWRKGKGQKSPRGRRDAFWVLDGTRCAEMGGCAAARRGEEATVEDPWKKHGETAVSKKPRASERSETETSQKCNHGLARGGGKPPKRTGAEEVHAMTGNGKRRKAKAKAKAKAKHGKKGKTHIVPVGLGELHGRGSPLDARAVDEDVDLASHHVERLGEYAPHGVKVGQVCVDNFDRAPEGGDGVGRLVVGRAGAAEEADVGPRLGEGDGAGCTDACGDAMGEQRLALGAKGGQRWCAWRHACGKKDVPRVAPVMRADWPASEKSCGAGTEGVGSMAGSDSAGSLAAGAARTRCTAPTTRSAETVRTAWLGGGDFKSARRRGRVDESTSGRGRWAGKATPDRLFPRIGGRRGEPGDLGGE